MTRRFFILQRDFSVNFIHFIFANWFCSKKKWILVHHCVSVISVTCNYSLSCRFFGFFSFYAVLFVMKTKFCTDLLEFALPAHWRQKFAPPKEGIEPNKEYFVQVALLQTQQWFGPWFKYAVTECFGCMCYSAAVLFWCSYNIFCKHIPLCCMLTERALPSRTKIMCMLTCRIWMRNKRKAICVNLIFFSRSNQKQKTGTAKWNR